MAFTGVGQRLGPGQENTIPPWETPSTPTVRTVPSLKDICLNTLDRYIDLLDDIGTTPYYLVESVLRKCNVKQLTRVELHTEALRKEEEEKYARISARLRQNYSQYDQEKQERRVILDPSLKPKKALRQPGSTSWSTPTAPKKKTLFEKARMEARRITQMYHTNPYPQQRSRTTSNNAIHNTARAYTQSSLQGQSTSGVRPGSGRIFAPTSVYTNYSVSTTQNSSSNRQDRTPLGQGAIVSGLSGATSAQPAASPIRTAKRYSYKSNPVVYLTTSRPSVASHSSVSHAGSNSGSMSPTSPTRSITTAKPTVNSSNGAIMEFFKQINPAHSHQATSSHHGLTQGGSRSPTSPVQPASKTMQMLRESTTQVITPNTSSSRADRLISTSSKKQAEPYARGSVSGNTMKQVKIDGDFGWLEDDDDDTDAEMDRDKNITKHSLKHMHHKRTDSAEHFQEGKSPPNSNILIPPVTASMYDRGHLK
ncbi:hypothetical protein FBU30_010767 [Linnemannia zychae]|nr:hypothetical protein FBU30_010767 [Linnemannia zychae]